MPYGPDSEGITVYRWTLLLTWHKAEAVLTGHSGDVLTAEQTLALCRAHPKWSAEVPADAAIKDFTITPA